MIQLRALLHHLHFKRPAATSRGALRERRIWVIEAFDDTAPERIGRSEAGVMPGLSIDDTPAYDANIEDFVRAFDAAHIPLPSSAWEPLGDVTLLLAPFDDSLLAQMPSLRFGVECALLDLLGGGRGILFASEFTAGHTLLPTHGLIWMDTPAGILQQIDAKVAAGFSVIKMKVGALDWHDELALLHEVRQRYPSVTLRLDANCAFASDTVLERLEQLAAFDIEYIEEPTRMTDTAFASALCAASPVPIGLDETLLGGVATGSIETILFDIRPQHVILKPSLLGGFARTQEIIALCDELGIQWWLNSLLESAIGHSAICQFAATTDNLRIHGLGTGSLFSDNFPSPIALEGAQLRWLGHANES